MQTVSRHLIQQEEIPATPHSPALTSSSIASPKCQVYHPQDELQPNTLHTDFMEKGKNMFSCISLLPFKMIKHPQEYAVCT